jgi:hypothetical protein
LIYLIFSILKLIIHLSVSFEKLTELQKERNEKRFYLLLILVFSQVQAQKDFQGLAVYESKTQAPKFEGVRTGNRDITPEMQKVWKSV